MLTLSQLPEETRSNSRLLWIGIGVVTALLTLGLSRTTQGRSADEHARRYFSMPKQAPVDSATLRNAILQLIPLGSSTGSVEQRLRERGLGADGLSSYSAPDSTGTAIIRIEFDVEEFALTKNHYGVFLNFDSAGRLAEVHVEEWVTGL